MDRTEKRNLTEQIRTWIYENLDLNTLGDQELEQQIREQISLRTSDRSIRITDQAEVCSMVFNSIRGYGILDTILADDEITEIMINGYDTIFIEKNGVVSKLDMSFESDAQLLDIIQRIVAEGGREVNQSNPIVDTRLSDGSRVNVVLPPISAAGPIVTIRKFSKQPMTMERLLSYGSITPEVAEFLNLLVRAKYNIFISGGTGSGKTTFLNALTNYIPADERLITIEDSLELQIEGKSNLNRMETRNANVTGKGEITIRNLIRTSLRMRPERIIVGEVRGEEALDMLQAMNTGHDGSLSTGHANSCEDAVSRLETMVLQGAAQLPLQAIRNQIASAVDIIIHLSRLRDHSRKTMEISEVLGVKNGEVEIRPLYHFEEDTEKSTMDHVEGTLVRTEHPFVHTGKLKLAGLWQEYRTLEGTRAGLVGSD